MSNRTDFDNVASELVEMFGLNPDAEDQGTGKLQWRIERELHNAYVAGQEQSALDEAPETSSDENLALYEAQRLLDLMRSGTAIIVRSVNSHQRIVDFKFQIPALSDGTTTLNGRFGLASVYAEIDSNTSPNMQFVTRAGSTRTRVDSGITIAAGTRYRGQFVVTKNASVDFRLAAEGTPLPSSPIATITTNIPSWTGQALLPNFVIEMSAGATSEALLAQEVERLADELDSERQRTDQERAARMMLQQNFDTVVKQRNAAEAELRARGLFPDEATVVEERITGKRV